MLRTLTPEILDDLPPSDSRAIKSRNDLRRVNRWMRQRAIMARLLRRYGESPPATITEIGCGDGSFMLDVARSLAPRWPGVRLRLIDRLDIIPTSTLHEFAGLGWTATPFIADVFDALAQIPRSDIICANLFLHHFEGAALRALLVAIAAKSNFFAACEPRRARLGVAGGHATLLIGCNGVTRHDAVASVRAGFAGNELSQIFPPAPSWEIREAEDGMFSHGFTARRRDMAGVA